MLLSDDGQAKVADFGLASTDGATIESGKLPIKWTAPEVSLDSDQRSEITLKKGWTLDITVRLGYTGWVAKLVLS